MHRICRPTSFESALDAVRSTFWAIAGFVAYAVVCLDQNAFADPIKPVPIEKDHLSVDMGRTSVFQTTSDIKEVRIADPRVCAAEVIGNDQNAIGVTGLARGSTTLTVWLTKPNTTPQTYVIDVVTAGNAYKQLSDFILLQFPGSRITLTPVPSSRKVIVSGAATSYYEWGQILALIDGTIPRADLILRVTYPCPPCSPCTFRCRPPTRHCRVFR